MSDPESWISLEKTYGRLADRAIQARNKLNAEINALSNSPQEERERKRARDRKSQSTYYAKNRDKLLAAHREMYRTGAWPSIARNKRSSGKPTTNLGKPTTNLG